MEDHSERLLQCNLNQPLYYRNQLGSPCFTRDDIEYRLLNENHRIADDL